MRRAAPLTVLQAGLIGSDLSDGVYRVVLPLLAAAVTRSPLLVGLVAVGTRFPWLLFGLPAGSLLDRVNLRRALQQSALLRCLTLLGMAALHLTGLLSIPYLIAAALIVGACGVCFDLATQSSVARITDSSRLEKANARVYALQVAMNQLAGPALGGLVGGAATTAALGSLGGGYAAVAGVMTGLPSLPARPEPRRSFVSGIGRGLARVWQRSDLRRLAVIGAMQNLAYAAVMSVLVLYLVRPGPVALPTAAYGFILTATAVGGLIGARLTPLLAARLGRTLALRLTAPFPGLGLAAIGTSLHTPIIVTGLLVYGLATMSWNVIVVTHRQRSLPGAAFSSVNAAFRWITWGAMPIGSLLGGVLGESIGLRWTFFAVGIAAGLAGLAAPQLAAQTTAVSTDSPSSSPDGGEEAQQGVRG